MHRLFPIVLAAGALSITLAAQQAPAPGTPRAVAPIDLTGNWVSIVTEDWRFRMVTPPAKYYASVPLNAAARAIADKWDPAKDEAEGNACKSYGAANIMRVPGRLHISWQDDQTLKIETDAGEQTRLFHFNGAPSGEPSRQGYSAAEWEFAGGRGGAAGFGGGGGRGGGGGGRGGPGAGGPPPPRGGSLKVVTTRLKEGYLRKNGVPYSENAVVTDYFDLMPQGSREPLLVVTTIVEDPDYLTQPFIVSTQFRKQADARGWDPTPCSATW